MALQLYEPDERMGQALADWNHAWKGENVTPASLRMQGSYADWLSEARRLHDAAYAAAKGLVAGRNYFLMEDPSGPILAASNLRLSLTESLLLRGGHIGYGTLPAQRGKGYATLTLRLTLEKAREFELDRVLLTCSRTNLASVRTILHCGGVLEDEVSRADGGVTQRYWISLT